MWGLFLKLISNQIVWVFLAFIAAVAYATDGESHPPITPAMQRSTGGQVVLISAEEQAGKYPKRCDSEMLMQKDGNGYWVYVKPDGAGSAGRATIKCK